MTQAKSNPTKIYAIIGLVAAVIAIGLSAFLACKHAGVCQFSAGCTLESGVDGCGKLGESSASKIAGTGIPIAYAGLFYYLFVGGLFLIYILRAGGREFKASHLITTLTFMVVVGVVIDIFLGYQNFALNNSCAEGEFCGPLCKLCFYTYITQAIIAFAAIMLYMKEVKDSDDAGSLKSAWTGFVDSWPAPTAALILTLLIGGVISLAGKPGDTPAGEEFAQPPMPPEAAVTRAIKDLDENAKKLQISTAGLTSYEGPENPVVVIHKWADFMCPHCYHTGEDLKVLRKRWPNRVGIYYRYLPLDGACNFLAQGSNPQLVELRCGTAKAAACASRQDPGFFADVYHGIFDLMPREVYPTQKEVQKLVAKYGGDWNAIQSCMQSDAQGMIDRDLTVIDGWIKNKNLKGASTPIVTIDGYFLGAGSPDRLSMIYWVDSIILKKEGQRARDDFAKRFPAAR